MLIDACVPVSSLELGLALGPPLGLLGRGLLSGLMSSWCVTGTEAPAVSYWNISPPIGDWCYFELFKWPRALASSPGP